MWPGAGAAPEVQQAWNPTCQVGGMCLSGKVHGKTLYAEIGEEARNNQRARQAILTVFPVALALPECYNNFV